MRNKIRKEISYMRKTRLWSILLVFAMLLTLLPVTALADDTVWDGTAVDTS